MGRLYDLDNNCLLNVLLRVDGQHAHSAVLSCQAFANLWKRHEVQVGTSRLGYQRVLRVTASGICSTMQRWW
jgi:hypothetical protein